MLKERGPLSACNVPSAILSDKSDGANNSRWLPGRSGKLGDTWTGVRVRCRSVTRKAVTDAYGEGTPPGVQRSPDNSSPPGVSLACQSRRVPSAVTAMSHERNGKV